MARFLPGLVRMLPLFAVLMALTMAAALRAHAAPGVDVVVLVDQSGSMWGHPKYHPRANDSGAFRIDTVKEIVVRLAADVEGSNREHRISIFSFDRAVVPYRQDLRLSFDPNRPDEARLQAQAAMRGFAEIRNMDRPWTNTPGAFAEAVREFARMRGASSGADVRPAHLLLITDGRPYLDGASVGALREDIRRSARALRDNGVQLWVLGINDADAYWTQAKDNLSSDGEFWQAVTGDNDRASLAEFPSFPSVQKIVARFVDSWLATSSQEVVAGQPYEVPPFQRRVTFTATFNVPNAPLQIIDPQRQPIPMPPRDPSLKFLRVSVPNPQPGPYQFVLDGKLSYAIRAELFPPEAELVSPLGRPPLDADTSLIVRARGDNGQPLSLDPAQVTKAEIAITAAGGHGQTIAAKVEAGARFEAPWRPTQPGAHALTISVEATHNGSRYPVFAQIPTQPASIDISSERPFYLALTDPDAAATIVDFPPIDELEISVALVDSAGIPIDQVAAYVTAPGQWLSVVPTDASGVPLGAPIRLAFDSTDKRWHGTVPVSADWTSGEGWYSPAQVFLRFQPAQQRLGQDWVLSGLSLPASAIDRRVGGDGFSVGPIEVSWPGWLRWAILSLALILVVGGLALALWLIVRALIISSLDDPRKGRLELRVFDPVRDPHALNAQRIQVQGVIRLNKDRQIKADVGGRPVVIEKFRYRRSLQAGRRAMARIVYRWPGQKKDGGVNVNADGPARLLAGPNAESYSVALGYKK